MKAWRAHEFGDYKEVLKFDDCDRPKPTGAQALIKVSCVGLNFPDILAIAGQYQVKAPLPMTPGGEVSGEIVETGPDCPHKVGDRVMTLCDGSYAEYTLSRGAGTFPIPESMSDAEAAGFIMTYQTSYFALDYRANLQPGETLLVHGGAGGVGTSAIQIGKAMGATVIATAGTAEKLEICRQCGADHLINYSEDDFIPIVKELTGGRGADVIYDPVGGDVFDGSTKCIAFCGRILVIGFTSGRIPTVACNRILLKNIAIVGLFWGNYNLFEPQKIIDTQPKLYDLYEQGKIKPVIYKEYPLDQAVQALQAIEDRQSHGKVVLRAV